MDNKEKFIAAAAVVGAFALGWWLHKPKSGGNVNLTVSVGPSVYYSLTNPDGSVVYIPQSNQTQTQMLGPGDYLVHADFQGG